MLILNIVNVFLIYSILTHLCHYTGYFLNVKSDIISHIALHVIKLFIFVILK